MAKELVLLDIDDVIATNAEGFTRWSNEQFGTDLTAADYDEDFLTLWPDTDLDEIHRRASLFHESDAMASYGRIEEAKTSLDGLTEWYRFIAATSRRRASEKVTRAWLQESYDGIIEDVVFAGIYDEPSGRGHHLRTKADIYRRLKPGYVMDDQYKHCRAAAELGIQAVLYGDYRWTRKQDIHANVTWCPNWPSAVRYFRAAAHE